MPLIPGPSKAAIKNNIEELSKTGRPHAQVVAIALHNAGHTATAKRYHPDAAKLHAEHLAGETTP